MRTSAMTHVRCLAAALLLCGFAQTASAGFVIEPVDACAGVAGSVGELESPFWQVRGPLSLFEGGYHTIREDGRRTGSCLKGEVRTFVKDEEFRDSYNRAADRLDIASSLLNSIGTVGGCTSPSGCVLTGVDLLVGSNGPWTEGFITAVGVVAAIASASPVDLAIASAGLTSTFLDGIADHYRQIAADPPDFNYNEVFHYGETAYSFDWGLGSETNALLNETYSALGRLNDNGRGILTSLERFQGALLSGDAQAAARQASAYQQFVDDRTAYSIDAGNALLGLSGLLQGMGAPDLTDGVNGFASSAYMAVGTALGGSVSSEPTSVPEPGALALLCIGLFGLIFVRRNALKKFPAN